MKTDPRVPPEVMQLLDDMLAADGYHAVVHTWPTNGVGRPTLEIVAGEGACLECLVPKSMLAKVLAKGLPAGISLEEPDLIYPTDGSQHGHDPT